MLLGEPLKCKVVTVRHYISIAYLSRTLIYGRDGFVVLFVGKKSNFYLRM